MDSHELQPLTGDPSSTTALSTAAFLARISSLTTQLNNLDSSISHASALNSRIASSVAPTPQSTEALDAALSSTQHHVSAIRNDLAFLTADVSRTRAPAVHDASSSFSIKSQHLARVKADFRARLQTFHESEARLRASNRDQLARQYRIVQPQASDDDIAQLVQSAAPYTNVFAQATLTSGEQAERTLAAVRQRHADLELIEKAMVELAHVMQELDTMIVLQEDVVSKIEENSEDVVKDLETANIHLEEAQGWAEKLRRHKWICLGLSVVIVLVLVLVIVLAVVLTKQAVGGQ